MPVSQIPEGLRWMSEVSVFCHGYQGVVLAIYGENRDTLVKLIMTPSHYDNLLRDFVPKYLIKLSINVKF